MKLKRVVAVAALMGGAVLLTACGDDGDSETDTGSSPDRSTSQVTVVASTNVWGDVVSQVGGDAVKVTSIISDPAQDPHSYEASATTALEISKADLIIENGGGYDDFVDRMVSSTDSKAPVLNAVEISGKTAPSGGELNEHVWYDVPTVEKVAEQVAAELGSIDPDNASTYTANATAFTSKLEELVTQEAALKSAHTGEAIGITEPVPLYLTEAAGLVNATPEEFAEAIEEGDDVSAAVLKETLDLYTEHQVKALVYNEQTSGPITEQVKQAAEDNDVPVVPVTETLPEGLDYVSWMQGNIDNLASALG